MTISIPQPEMAVRDEIQNSEFERVKGRLGFAERCISAISWFDTHHYRVHIGCGRTIHSSLVILNAQGHLHIDYYAHHKQILRAPCEGRFPKSYCPSCITNSNR